MSYVSSGTFAGDETPPQIGAFRKSFRDHSFVDCLKNLKSVVELARKSVFRREAVVDRDDNCSDFASKIATEGVDGRSISGAENKSSAVKVYDNRQRMGVGVGECERIINTNPKVGRGGICGRVEGGDAARGGRRYFMVKKAEEAAVDRKI